MRFPAAMDDLTTDRLLELGDPLPEPGRSVRTELTMSGACEATVLLEEGNRVRAAAARLELMRERWILTGLEMA